MTVENNRTVLGTTGGVVGAKTAVVVNEVTDQAADLTLSFAKNIGRSRLASFVGAKAKDAVANAMTDEAKEARALKLHQAKAFGKKLASKIPVDFEIVDAIKADAAHVKAQFDEIDGVNEDAEVLELVAATKVCTRCESPETENNGISNGGICEDCILEMQRSTDPDYAQQ